MSLPKGKHVNIDQDFPSALGICDKSRFVFNHKDLVKQMEWRGNALVWTGFLVGRPYVDVPNEQLRPPILPPDPVPVKMPRLPQGNLPYMTGVPALPENQRVAELKTFNWQAPSVKQAPNKNSPDGIPALPEDLRLEALERFHWSA